jgi:hypothetical protein
LKYGNEQQEAIKNIIEQHLITEDTPLETMDALIFQYFKTSILQ